MRRKSIVYLTLVCGIFGFSCTGMKNMSSTLSKSDGSGVSSESRHGDYIGSAGKVDSVRSTQAEPVSSRTEQGRDGSGYRRDYGRLTDSKPDTPGGNGQVVGNPDMNQKLVNQYAEMDKLGDLVLYEIDITEKRYTKLLDQFKNANNNDRDAISRELDKLNADQLLLYKTYTNIYKYGKSDWPKVKSDVDKTLMDLRGIDRK